MSMLKSECVLLKLISGETVLAKFVEENDKGILITDVLTVNLEQTFSDAGVRPEMTPRFFVQAHSFMGVGGLIKHEHIMLRFPGTDIHDGIFKLYDAMITKAHKDRSGIEIVHTLGK